jgi:hypothetical protein
MTPTVVTSRVSSPPQPPTALPSPQRDRGSASPAAASWPVLPDPDEHFRRFAHEIQRLAVMTRRQLCRIFRKAGVKLVRVR